MLTYETSEIQKGLMATRYGQNTCDETRNNIAYTNDVSKQRTQNSLEFIAGCE